MDRFLGGAGSSREANLVTRRFSGSGSPSRHRVGAVLRPLHLLRVLALLGSIGVGPTGCASSTPPAGDPVSSDMPRAVSFDRDLGWRGHAVCYGPFRDGQSPDGASPTPEQLLEDLRIMERHWSLLRVYGSRGATETLVGLIHEHDLKMKVVVGAWIAAEETRDESGEVIERFPDVAEANQAEVATAAQLAHRYPDVVAAISIGNETQVYWSGHRSPLDILITYVREARSKVSVPVTVADDFNFWNKPESRELAVELDFLLLHAHPMWNGLQLDAALGWLQAQVADVETLHPDRPVVVGETGWATSVHSEGEQATLIQGRPGEDEQEAFYDSVRNWSAESRFPVFWFEAFDEKWKGGSHPAEVEKHWGVFRSDRSSKAAVK